MVLTGVIYRTLACLTRLGCRMSHGFTSTSQRHVNINISLQRFKFSRQQNSSFRARAKHHTPILRRSFCRQRKPHLECRPAENAIAATQPCPPKPHLRNPQAKNNLKLCLNPSNRSPPL
ncbi:hypothetical protein I7I50_06793 [Histoplasma capsulatum G186AR]|uniref:Uncharacterized protein n=1 Tax=Ajellomyces capsulatus TaxID=5037 RepID=A0A8H7Z0D8_AJECA|nr:hypothetical protein I7I52_10133 [Histoplasma capsulatum]QSS67650.1 hypothetical protein I7I50_06793 [Histoplasma capsulatum G186AR]